MNINRCWRLILKLWRISLRVRKCSKKIEFDELDMISAIRLSLSVCLSLSRLPFYFLPNQMRLCWARHHHHITRRTRCLVNWSNENLLRCAQFPPSTFLIRKRNDRDIHLRCESFVIHCKHTHTRTRSSFRRHGSRWIEEKLVTKWKWQSFSFAFHRREKFKTEIECMQNDVTIHLRIGDVSLALRLVLFDRRPKRRKDSSFSSDFKLLHFYFHSRLFIQVIVIIFVMQPTEKPIESPTGRKQNAKNTIHIEIEHVLASDFLVLHTTHSSLRRIIKSKVMSMWI